MKTFVCFFLAMLLARPVVLQANHTHEDQMLLARSVLKVVRSSARDILTEELLSIERPDRHDTWEGFLGPATTEWTMADRKEAFGAYLSLGAEGGDEVRSGSAAVVGLPDRGRRRARCRRRRMPVR